MSHSSVYKGVRLASQQQGKINPAALQTIKRYPHWFLAIVLSIIVGLYWNLIATNRFVSEANVVLESPQIAAPTLTFQSLISGGGAQGRGDMLLLRDHLLSVDMLNKLQAQLDVRDHYSGQGGHSIDWLSRMRRANLPMEDFHKYFKKRVSVELDDYAQVLRVRVEAFDAETAQTIAQLLLTEGEQHMNNMGQRLAQEQIRFLEIQVNELSERFDEALGVLIEYQNQSGLVSPQGTVESINAVVAGLESQLANLQARRSALLSFQSARSPEVVRVDSEIQALNQQINQERARMAQASGGALNTISSEYQLLELKTQFAKESYSGALAALENTRIDAARKLKQISVLQSPSLAEYAIEPRRVYNTAVFAIIALFLAIITQMLVLIIKDHLD